MHGGENVPGEGAWTSTRRKKKVLFECPGKKKAGLWRKRGGQGR